jgi:hypothetical protein
VLLSEEWMTSPVSGGGTGFVALHLGANVMINISGDFDNFILFPL